MKLIFYRDKKKKKLIQKFEFKRLFLLSLLKSKQLSFRVRKKLYRKFIFVYPKYSVLCGIKYRCTITNNARSVRVVSGIVLSRHMLREKLSFGQLFPFFKSSW